MVGLKWTNNPEKLNSWDKQVRVVDKFGNVRFLRNGELHRDGDLPAIEHEDGRKAWYKNGIFMGRTLDDYRNWEKRKSNENI